MTGFRIIRRLRDLIDFTFGTPADGDVVTYDEGTDTFILATPTGGGGGGGGAPTDANYLVGTANGSLSAEIVVGTSPGGELGGTWASPTVDATHSGSSHATVQSAAEATAAAALAAHDADTTSIHGIANTANLYASGGTDVAVADGGTGSSTAGGARSNLGAAPADATYIMQTANSETSAEQALSSLATGMVKVTTTTGALSTGTEGTDYYKPAGTDVAVVDGGTGSSTAAGARTNLGLVIATDVEAHDPDLTTIAGLSPSNDDIIQRKAGAWANRTIAQLLTDLAAPGTTFQPLDSDLTAFAGLAIAADKLPYGTGSHTLGLADLTSFIRSLLDDADAATARATLGVIASLFQSGGAQALALDTLAAPSDVTTLNASTSAHGLLKKLSNTATEFLDGTGAWDTVKDADLSTSDVTTNNVSTSKHGFAPKAPNDATKFLDGTGAYSVPSGGGGGCDLIGFQRYAPDPQAFVLASSSSLAALDSTNLTVSFTVPSSGKVMVTFNAFFVNGSGSNILSVGLFLHGTTTLVDTLYNWQPGDTGSGFNAVSTLRWHITGLTPSASVQYDIAAASASGSAGIYASGLTTPAAGSPATLEVWSVSI